MNIAFTLNGTPYFLSTTPHDDLDYVNHDPSATQERALISIIRAHEKPIESALPWSEFVSIWNDMATRRGWRKLMVANNGTREMFIRARRDLPNRDQWVAVIRGLSAHPFFSTIKPSPTILFNKKRYFEFYQDAVENEPEPSVDDVLDSINASIPSVDEMMKRMRDGL